LHPHWVWSSREFLRFLLHTPQWLGTTTAFLNVCEFEHTYNGKWIIHKFYSAEQYNNNNNINNNRTLYIILFRYLKQSHRHNNITATRVRYYLWGHPDMTFSAYWDDTTTEFYSNDKKYVMNSSGAAYDCDRRICVQQEQRLTRVIGRTYSHIGCEKDLFHKIKKMINVTYLW